ncbi:MAG: hypothetical protein HY533_04805 [Chloroflexi bacterium]|nr:hypothetical protein [Chloroflexota bacterium]
MTPQRGAFSGWEPVMLLGPLPGLAAVAALVLVSGIPTVTVLGVALIAYAVLWAGVTEAKAAAKSQVAVEERALELQDIVPISGFAATITVTQEVGFCPLGFRPGQTWQVDEYGKVSRPLCRPAMTALALGLEEAARGAPGDQVSCRCPLKQGEVVFAIGSPAT